MPINLLTVFPVGFRGHHPLIVVGPDLWLQVMVVQEALV